MNITPAEFAYVRSPRATLDDALRVFKRLAAPVEAVGYALALYGSTLKSGRGNDVDLLAVPVLPVGHQAVLEVIASAGFERVDTEPYRGAMGTISVRFTEASTNIVVDLQIREAGERRF